jgi:16S rRNA (cytidine1402-2'-O)-methyltransferase
MVSAWGDARQAAVCRELTKRFEEVVRGSLAEVQAALTDRTLKGEIVLVVDRDRRPASSESMEELLVQALSEMSLKDAASHVAEVLGLPRRQVYQAGLQLGKSE